MNRFLTSGWNLPFVEAYKTGKDSTPVRSYRGPFPKRDSADLLTDEFSDIGRRKTKRRSRLRYVCDLSDSGRFLRRTVLLMQVGGPLVCGTLET